MIILVKALSLEMANVTELKALENNIKISIAIIDNHDNLKYYRHMNGNSYITVRMSKLKANTSSSMPILTKGFAQRNEKIPNGPYIITF